MYNDIFSAVGKICNLRTILNEKLIRSFGIKANSLENKSLNLKAPKSKVGTIKTEAPIIFNPEKSV